MLLFIFMIYVVFLNWSQFVQVCCCCFFIYVLPLRSNYQEVWIPLTGLTLPHICACPTPGPGFLMSYVMILFLMFSELRWEVIVRFVNISGIFDHHSCLNFFFHKKVASLLKFWCVFIHLKKKKIFVNKQLWFMNYSTKMLILSNHHMVL